MKTRRTLEGGAGTREVSSSRLDRGTSVRVHVVMILTLPLVLLVIQPDWPFNSDLRDPWIYYGFFRRTHALLSAFGDQYFASRLSIILPGHFLHALLPPAAATMTLHVLMHWIASLSLYFTAAALFDPLAALVTTLLFGTDPFVLDSLGSDYPDSFGITYLLASYLLLTLAVSARRPSGLLFGGGVCLGALVTANLAYSIPAAGPVLLFELLQRRRRTTPISVVRSFLLLGAGALAAWIAFSFAGHSLGGPRFFLESSFRAGGNVLNKPFFDAFKAKDERWFGHAVWLVLPGLILLAAAIRLARPGPVENPARPQARLVQAQMIAFGVLFLALEFSRVRVLNYFLEYSFYSSLLLPIVYLALAALLSMLLPAGVPRRRFVASFAALLGCAGAVFWFGGRFVGNLATHSRHPVLSPLLAGAAGCLLLAAGTRRTWVVGISILSLVFAQNLAMRVFYDLGSEFPAYGSDKKGVARQIDDCVAVLAAQDPPALAHFWFSRFEKPSQLYDLIASTNLSNYRTLAGDFPRLDSCWTTDGMRIRPGMRLVVLTARGDPTVPAAEALSRCGVEPELLVDRRIDGPAGPFGLSLFRLEAAEEDGRPPSSKEALFAAPVEARPPR